VSVRRVAVAAVVTFAVAAAAVLVRPARYEVDGLSMAPGLMPGDVVTTGRLPAADRLRRPQRFERWIVIPPDGNAALKRIAGLPTEMVEIRNGDLVVDGAVVLKTPAELGEVALPVTLPLNVGERHATLPTAEVLDDDAFAAEVNRVLEPVRDVGVVAALQTGTQPSRATVTLATTTIGWQLPPQTCIRVIAGRLDGHLVAVAWRDRAADTATARRSGVPAAAPSAWSFAEPCGDAPGEPTPPRCEVRVDVGVRIDRIAIWRDAHLRPGTDGGTSWRLDDDSYLMLGDFPSGSIDSRTWGPLRAAALRHRVQPSP